MPGRRFQIRTHALAYLGLAALFLLAVIAFARDVSDSIDLLRHASEYARAPFYLGDANWGAVGLQPEAEAAGMKLGDTVLAVNGRPVDGFFVYYGTLRQARAGDRLRVQVQSPGPGTSPIRELPIDLRPYRSSFDPAGLPEHVEMALRVVILPVVCVALGFWVAAVRVADLSAWLLLMLLLSFPSHVGGGGIGPMGIFGREASLQPLFAGFGTFLSLIAAPSLMLFGIAFPERLALDRRFPLLKWILAGYLVLVSAIEAINVGLWVHHLELARPIQRTVELFTGVEGDFHGAMSFLALMACAGSLGWKAMTAPSRDARRRLLLLFVGAAPGVVALIIILVAFRLEYSLPAWSLLPLMTMVLALPLTMAYVIVVRQDGPIRPGGMFIRFLGRTTSTLLQPHEPFVPQKAHVRVLQAPGIRSGDPVKGLIDRIVPQLVGVVSSGALDPSLKLALKGSTKRGLVPTPASDLATTMTRTTWR